MAGHPHRTEVTARAHDPAARSGKRVYKALDQSSVGIELGLSVAIGLLIGYYLDAWLGTKPWLMLLWLLFGLIAGFRGVVRAVSRADRAAQEGPLGQLGEQAPPVENAKEAGDGRS